MRVCSNPRLRSLRLGFGVPESTPSIMPASVTTLQSEISSLWKKKFNWRVRDIFPKKKVTYLEVNHFDNFSDAVICQAGKKTREKSLTIMLTTSIKVDFSTCDISWAAKFECFSCDSRWVGREGRWHKVKQSNRISPTAVGFLSAPEVHKKSFLSSP